MLTRAKLAAAIQAALLVPALSLLTTAGSLPASGSSGPTTTGSLPASGSSVPTTAGPQPAAGSSGPTTAGPLSAGGSSGPTPTAAPPPGPFAPAATYVPPVPGQVAQGFDPPEHPWEPGHRGVDLWSARGDVVASPGAGVVTFAGTVAGKPVVVVTHPDGLRSSLEPVEATVPRGTAVRAGEAVGVLVATPGDDANPDHCAALVPPADGAACAHWGMRRGETYLDPLTLLGAAPPIVLLPPA